MLHANLNRIQVQKLENYEIVFKTYDGHRSRKVFDKERIFILAEEDRDKYKFFEQFRDEVIDKGFDYIGLYQRQYKR